jgi:hypothetical protein
MVQEIKKRKIAVVGVGSAGIQTLCHFLVNTDALEYEVISIHDPSTPILGIGESTNPTFVSTIEAGLQFNLYEHLDELDGTLKLGTMYEGWRKHDFINPLLSGNAAIHLNTFKLKGFALPRLHKRWGKKFSEIEGHISDIIDGEDYAAVVIDGTEHRFDFVIDCRGFPKDYSECEVMPYTTVNRALVHNIEEKDDRYSWTHTKHKATPDGWMFAVPLQSRKSYGYMFNDNITSVEDAKENFSKEINVPVDQLQSIEYKFQSYRAKNIIGNRVFKNGNAAVFFEPMFANSLWLYDIISGNIFGVIQGAISKEGAAGAIAYACSAVSTIIAYSYHGGSNYDTEFWKQIIKPTTYALQASNPFYDIVHRMRFMDSRNYIEPLAFVFGATNLKLIDDDEHFGYGYFDAIPLAELQKLKLQAEK